MSNTKNMLTAERLKSCRLKANRTLEQIGTLVGVHKTTVMRWEKGETERIGLPIIQTLASYYGVNPAWLMGADVSMYATESDTSKVSISPVTDNDIKFALFGGEEEITDEMYDEVKNFAEYVKQKYKNKKE